MRIIGGKDFYDNALSYGYDDSIVFVRNPKGINKLSCNTRSNVNSDIPSAPNFLLSALPFERENSVSHKNIKINFHPFSLIFCGKIYAGIVVDSVYDKNSLMNNGELLPYTSNFNRKFQYFYTFESFISYLEKHGFDNIETNEDIEVGRRSGWDNHKDGDTAYKFIEKKYKKYFYISEIKDKNLLDFLCENRISIITQDQNVTYEYYSAYVINSDNLGEYDFYKVMEPPQVFQELSMFNGSFLTQNKDGKIKLSDKSLIQKHGFDKMSFRKPPKSK